VPGVHVRKTFTNPAHISAMAHPILHPQPHPRPFADLGERHDALRMIMEWIADRFADTQDEDTSIAWEDGEEHDEPQGPATL
jgi:hypothetical protein